MSRSRINEIKETQMQEAYGTPLYWSRIHELSSYNSSEVATQIGKHLAEMVPNSARFIGPGSYFYKGELRDKSTITGMLTVHPDGRRVLGIINGQGINGLDSVKEDEVNLLNVYSLSEKRSDIGEACNLSNSGLNPGKMYRSGNNLDMPF